MQVDWLLERGCDGARKGWIGACGGGRDRVQLAVYRGVELKKLQVVVTRGTVRPGIDHGQIFLLVVIDESDRQLATRTER